MRRRPRLTQLDKDLIRTLPPDQRRAAVRRLLQTRLNSAVTRKLWHLESQLLETEDELRRVGAMSRRTVADEQSWRRLMDDTNRLRNSILDSIRIVQAMPFAEDSALAPGLQDQSLQQALDRAISREAQQAVAGGTTEPSIAAVVESKAQRQHRRFDRLRALGGGRKRTAGGGWEADGKVGALAALVREEAEAGRPWRDRSDVTRDLDEEAERRRTALTLPSA